MLVGTGFVFAKMQSLALRSIGGESGGKVACLSIHRALVVEWSRSK